MQVGGALQGGSAIPRRRRLNVLVAIGGRWRCWYGQVLLREAKSEQRTQVRAPPSSTMTRGNCAMTRRQTPPSSTTTRVTCTLTRVYRARTSAHAAWSNS